jgi:hypothetical protein
VAVDERGSTLVCRGPTVQARVDGHVLGLGEPVTVRVRAADPATRRVEFAPD